MEIRPDETVSNYSVIVILCGFLHSPVLSLLPCFEIVHKANKEYCHDFDLSTRIPDSVVEEALQAKRLYFIGAQHEGVERTSKSQILDSISDVLKSTETGLMSQIPFRISIPSLGSPQWGELVEQVSHVPDCDNLASHIF
jgi:hypothetical protein